MTKTVVGDRKDRAPMYVCVIIALFLWSLSLLIAGPIHYSILDELSDATQNILGGSIFIGSSMCLTGILIGTRRCYAWGIAGVPALSIAVAVYFWAAVNDSISPILSGMGSALSLMIPVGAVWTAVYFWRERRRIEANIPIVLDELGGDE